MNLKDLTPKGDVKAGAPHGHEFQQPQQQRQHQRWSPHPPPHFFEFKLVHVLMLLALLANFFTWWLGRESMSNEATNAATKATTAQEMIVAEHGRRFDANDKRLDTFDNRMNELAKVQGQNTNDLHELMTKFRIMVELVDGARQKPELHTK